MKKIVYAFIVFIGVFFLISCNEKVDLNLYVSQIRNGVYEGEVNGIKLTVYEEKREDPLLCDGYVGNLKSFLICKVDSDDVKLDNVEITIEYLNKKYSGKFEFNPINAKYTTLIEVDKIDRLTRLDAELKSNGEIYNINLVSKIVAKTISYKKAIDSVANYDKKTIDKYFKSSKISTEIHVRILKDDNRNYYYVGIVNNQGGVAYLVDGLNGKILAKKQLNNLNG